VGASWPRWSSLDDAIGWAAVWASEQATRVDPSIDIDLPTGPAAYVDVHYAYGREMRDTVFRDGVRWFLLRCGGEDLALDRWHSIAQTFEFVPADG
jgi:hypothetical protein